MFLGLRALAALVFVLGIWVAWLLVEDDQVGLAIWALLASSAFLVATLLNPLSRAFRVALLVALIAMLALIGLINPLALGLLGVFALLGWVVIRRRLPQIQVDPESVRALDGNEVMAGAEGFVEQFEDLRWSQIGAVGFDIMGRTIVESVLVPDVVDRYALVTDVVLTIASQIDDIRWLVTRNSGVSDPGSSVLTNDLQGASPVELAQGHQVALDAVSRFGAVPVPLLVDDVVATAVRTEQASLAGGVRRRGRGEAGGPIDDSSEAERRIRSWLGIPTSD